MKWVLVNPLRTLPPLGLVAVGALVGVVGLPTVKKTARSLAVLTVRGALAVSDAVKDAEESVNQFWQEQVEEARTKETKMEETDTIAPSLQPHHFDTEEPVNTTVIPSADVTIEKSQPIKAVETPKDTHPHLIAPMVHEPPSNEVKNNSPKTKNDKKHL